MLEQGELTAIPPSNSDHPDLQSRKRLVGSTPWYPVTDIQRKPSFSLACQAYPFSRGTPYHLPTPLYASVSTYMPGTRFT